MSVHPTTLVTDSPAATRAVGECIGAALQPGDCVALTGPLGAGKTELVKGIAAGAGVSSDVTVNSPTFVIVNEYPGRLIVFHLDAYRLAGSNELSALGFNEMLSGQGAVMLEWADRVIECVPQDHLRIDMEHAGATSRRLTLRSDAQRWSTLMERIAALG